MKSRRGRVGRFPLDPTARGLIVDMAKPNPLWGAPRIHGELVRLGIEVHERAVSNIIRRFRNGGLPSQTWRAFLRNRECIDHMIVLNAEHLGRILADYFSYYHHDQTHLSLGKDTHPVVRLSSGLKTAKWLLCSVSTGYIIDTSGGKLLRKYAEPGEPWKTSLLHCEVGIQPYCPYEKPAFPVSHARPILLFSADSCNLQADSRQMR